MILKLQEILKNKNSDTTIEFKRLFHGRGGLYDGLRHITIDSIDKVLSVALFFKEPNEDEIITMLLEFVKSSQYQTLVIQRRYLKQSPSEVIFGTLPTNIFAIENGMKFKLNLLTNQNSLFFADMKNARAFVRENSKDKNVLNLFSYTCSFSVAAKIGGAKSVVNVDMSKASLSIGKANHSLNSVDTKGVSFLPYNILKSFSGIKKYAPFDLVIIDPPSYQKGSFDAKKDYIKVVNRLDDLASKDAIIVASLNDPYLSSEFLESIFDKSKFELINQIDNLIEFQGLDNNKALKVLLFKKI